MVVPDTRPHLLALFVITRKWQVRRFRSPKCLAATRTCRIRGDDAAGPNRL